MKKRKISSSNQWLRLQLAEKEHLLRKARLISLLLVAFNLFLLSVLFTTFHEIQPINAQTYPVQTIEVSPTPAA